MDWILMLLFLFFIYKWTGSYTSKVMADDGLFYENTSEASPKFSEDYPDSVFPPPAQEAMAFHMERW